jgi:hypothetical protein
MEYAYDLTYMVIFVATVQFSYVVSLLGNVGFVSVSGLGVLRFGNIALSFSCLVIPMLIPPSAEEIYAVTTFASAVSFLFAVFTYRYDWYKVSSD